jgi:hypothetical protein
MAEDTTPYNPVQVREKFTLQLDLFRLAFGHIKPPFPQVSLTQDVNPLGAVKALARSFRFRGAIGSPYTMPVAIGTTPQKDDANWMEIPCEPTIGIFGSKNVVETKLTRVDPRSKKIDVQNIIEETGLNNYQIRIRGVIYNEDDFDKYPEDTVIRLKQLWETPGGLYIQNAMLGMIEINKITIVGFDLPELPGYPGAQPFELRCLSDETDLYPLELV